jgi:hypothetical protein
MTKIDFELVAFLVALTTGTAVFGGLLLAVIRHFPG